VTSIVESPRELRPLLWVRTALLILFLLFGALASPWPWALLWLGIPVAVAASLLLAWRFGRAAIALPLVLAAAVAAGRVVAGESLPLWLTAWAPFASLVGVWMGWREEGGGPASGERAWMFVPLLLLASSLPLLPGFPAAVTRLDVRMRVEQEHMLASMKPEEVPASLRDALRQASVLPAEERQKSLLLMIPNAMFVWMVLLGASGRALAARVAGLLRWPPLSRSSLMEWRLPDAVLAPLIVGIGLLVFADHALQPSALTLLLNVVLGYSIQGVAVVESVLLSRGMSPAFVALTMLFVIAASLLWALPAVAVVGLSDVWLDYRRLEPSSEGEA
jgi:hypothetical protein